MYEIWYTDLNGHTGIFVSGVPSMGLARDIVSALNEALDGAAAYVADTEGES